MPVSSTILWRDLAQEAAGARRRLADYLWMLLWAAAVLAAVAAAGPEWRWNPSVGAGKFDIQVEMRGLPWAKEAELFLRAPDEARIVSIDAECDGKRVDLGGMGMSLADGVIARLPMASHIQLTFRSGGREVARRNLERQAELPVW